MPATKRTGLAVLICAGMLCAGTAMAQSAGDNAVQAAMDACEQARETDVKMHCMLHTMAAAQSAQAASEGSEGMIHFDFNDSNDTDAQKAAKQALSSALDTCETGSSGGAAQISQCRMEAFHTYQEAMGQ